MSETPARSVYDSLAPIGEKPELNSIFSLNHIFFAYNSSQKPVLQDVSLNLFPGQSLGLVGPNGSGKTTLFRCVTGLSRPQKGSIWHGDRQMLGEKDFVKMRRDTGFVLQEADDQLFFPVVLEDTMFGPLNMGLARREAEEAAKEALQALGIENLAHRMTRELSGGEKKLAAIAAILAMRPKALLLDEPLNGLDAKAKTRLENLLAVLPCAKIISAHDNAFLERLCQGRLRLNNGSLEIDA